jgi:hypothetical protein
MGIFGVYTGQTPYYVHAKRKTNNGYAQSGDANQIVRFVLPQIAKRDC